MDSKPASVRDIGTPPPEVINDPEALYTWAQSRLAINMEKFSTLKMKIILLMLRYRSIVEVLNLCRSFGEEMCYFGLSCRPD